MYPDSNKNKPAIYSHLTVLGVYKMVLANLNDVLKFNLEIIKYKWDAYYEFIHPYYIDITACSDYARYKKLYKLLYRSKLK